MLKCHSTDLLTKRHQIVKQNNNEKFTDYSEQKSKKLLFPGGKNKLLQPASLALKQCIRNCYLLQNGVRCSFDFKYTEEKTGEQQLRSQ